MRWDKGGPARRQSTAGDDTPQVQQETTPSIKQIRQEVMRTIAAVLQAHKEWHAHQTRVHEAASAVQKHTTALQRFSVDLGANLAALESQLKRQGELQLLAADAELQLFAEEAAWDATGEVMREAHYELSAAVTAARRRKDDSLTPVITAADYVSQQTDAARNYAFGRQSNAHHREGPATHATPDAVTAFDSLHRTLSAALRTSDSCRKFATELAEAEAAVRAHVTPNIKEPMRDSEEEIQRYLRQLEDFMTQRQRAHLLFSRLMKDKKAQDRSLQSAAQRVEDLVSPKYTTGTIEWQIFHKRKANVKQHLDNTQSALNAAGVSVDGWPLDDQVQPEATEEDEKKIRRANVLLHDMARALARYNEAQAGLQRVSADKGRSVSFDGISKNGSWEECREWWRQKEAEVAAVAGHNHIRDTRVKLATEALEHFQSLKKKINTYIKRYLLSTTAEKPRCDVLRALINAVAWTQAAGTPIAPTKQPGLIGQYPQY